MADRRTIIDKRLLVNIAKGTTAWAVLSALCATPALLDSANPMRAFLIVTAFTGAWFPTTLWAASRNQDSKFVGRWFVDLFDKTAAELGGMFNRNAKAKIRH